MKYIRRVAQCMGESEETSTGVHCCKEMTTKVEWPIPAIEVIDCMRFGN